MTLPSEMSVLQSDVRSDKTFLDFSLEQKPTPTIAKPTDVIIRMEAAPVNPSDIGVIFGASDRLKAVQQGPRCVSAPIAEQFRDSFEKDSYGNSRTGGIVCGNEGAGVVVAAGSNERAQSLIGKTVAVFGSGGCYAAYRRVNGASNAILPMPSGVTPRQAASSFVNPLTALGMLSTMRELGHTGLVHTAAASQLGQMMVRICMKDGVNLVNVVRKVEQEALLREIHPSAVIINQSSPTFAVDLAQAMKHAGATIGFDATGGGALSAQILSAFDAAGLTREGIQLYNYGFLDTSPSTMTKEQRSRTSFWLLPTWQAQHKKEFAENMRRVAGEITSTFATNYTAEVGMDQAVTLSALQVYAKQETGKKYLLNPQLVATSKL